MAEGLLTEREWRRQSVRAPRAARCWGAQCMFGKPRRSLKQDRAFQAALVMLSFTVAVLLPLWVDRWEAPPQYGVAVAQQEPAAEKTDVRRVSAVTYRLPEGLSCTPKTYQTEELLRGKLLLIDGEHPLPWGVPAPNTMSIATYGKGMVPVSDLTVKSGRETILALSRLFAELRGRGAGGFAVSRGTMTPWEQREWRLEALRSLAAILPLAQAVPRALAQSDAPGTGELQQEYSVELRLMDPASQQADDRPLERTEQGRILLQTAWRHGFIRADREGSGARSYRFRYVGEAHATAMTYLDLSLKEYLELLHQKQVLCIRRDSRVSYVILCQPMNGGYVELRLPQGAVWDASLDNMGHAVVACTLLRQEE